MNEVTRHFCWHQYFVPWGLSAPALGLYTCIKSWNKMYKIRLQRVFFKLVANDESDKRFLWHQIFVPWGCLPLSSSYTHLLNHEKMCIKTEIEEILFKLATKTIMIRPSCWYKIFGLNGLSIPTLGLCLNFFSSITADFNNPQHSGERYRTNGPLFFCFFFIDIASFCWYLKSLVHDKNKTAVYSFFIPRGQMRYSFNIF